MSKKIATKKQLETLFKRISNGDMKATGRWAINGFNISVVKPMSGNERYKKLYNARRKAGLCIICSDKVKAKNPNTGKPYRLCPTHRKTVDQARRGKGKK